jgi:hypothetical protein
VKERIEEEIKEAVEQAAKVIEFKNVSKLPGIALLQVEKGKQAGYLIANSPVGSAAYRQMKEHDVNIRFEFGEPPPDNLFDWGLTEHKRDKSINDVTIFIRNNPTSEDVAITFVHESSHARRTNRGFKIGTQLDEYRAFKREFLYMRNRRPTFEERFLLWKEVQRLYSDREIGGDVPVVLLKGGKQ